MFKTSSVPQFLVVKHYALNYHVVIKNVYVRCSQHPQTMLEVQYTEWCIKGISLLRSNEDNPQFLQTQSAKFATINFQLNFL